MAWGRAIEVAYQLITPSVEPVEVRQPVFVMGMERSGTTLVYSLLANHPEFYWFSTLDTVFPRSPAATSVIRRAFERVAARESYLAVPGTIAESVGRIAPSECGRFWQIYVPDAGQVRDDETLRERDVAPELAASLTLEIGIRMRLLGRGRLLAKRPGFALKIPYLRAIFPDAIFVDVVRRPADNIRSLTTVKSRMGDGFWGIRIPGWQDLTQLPWRLQAERQLEAVRAIVAEDAKNLPAAQYVQVSYDELLRSPQATMSRLLERLSLRPSRRVAGASARVLRPTADTRAVPSDESTEPAGGDSNLLD